MVVGDDRDTFREIHGITGDQRQALLLRIAARVQLAACYRIFDRLGWTASVAGIGMSLVLGMLLAFRLEIAAGHRPDARTAFQPTLAARDDGATQ